MKVKVTLIALILLATLFTGCTNKKNPGTNTTPTPSTAAPTTAATNAPSPTTAAVVSPTKAPTDVVTTASIVSKEDEFLKAISKDGTWIICLLNDLKVDKDLVLEGDFTNGKKDDAGKDIVQRKIALYAQDENRVITARYVLTAPKLTIKSPMASLQKGAFVGDLYVDVNNFELVDMTIDGNVYFTKQEYKDSFKMDETSKITGKQEVKK